MRRIERENESCLICMELGLRGNLFLLNREYQAASWNAQVVWCDFQGHSAQVISSGKEGRGRSVGWLEVRGVWSDVEAHHCNVINGPTLNVLKEQHCIQHVLCIRNAIRTQQWCDVLNWEDLNVYFIRCLDKEMPRMVRSFPKAVKVKYHKPGRLVQRLGALEAEISGQVFGRDGFFQGMWGTVCSRLLLKLPKLGWWTLSCGSLRRHLPTLSSRFSRLPSLSI